MNLFNTKIGKILTTDWIDLLIDKIVLYDFEKSRKSLIKDKRKNGLLEDERLCPADYECNPDFIENIEILGTEKLYDEEGNYVCITHQKVTYIDRSIKNFNIHTTLTCLPIPESYKTKKKLKSNI